MNKTFVDDRDKKKESLINSSIASSIDFPQLSVLEESKQTNILSNKDEPELTNNMKAKNLNETRFEPILRE